MVILVLVILGLCLGSFVNALVYRLHEQSVQGKGKRAKGKGKKTSKLSSQPSALSPDRLSITKGRSMCPHCRHELAAKDLIPVVSWLMLSGKCRYCHKPINWQYPAVELATAALFVLSYVFWPEAPMDSFISYINFGAWLIFLTGFMALLVYDLKWMLLPNRIIYPLLLLAGALALLNLLAGDITIGGLALSVAIAGGLFYLLFMVSNGNWIGGGDVKLGALIGLILSDPYLAFMSLLLASVLGTLVVLPGMALKKVTTRSRIPFGPFLIVACILVMLFGADVVAWYKEALLLQG